MCDRPASLILSQARYSATDHLENGSFRLDHRVGSLISVGLRSFADMPPSYFCFCLPWKKLDGDPALGEVLCGD